MILKSLVDCVFSCTGVSLSPEPSPSTCNPLVSLACAGSSWSSSFGFGTLGVAVTPSIAAALHFAESGTLKMVLTLMAGPPSRMITLCSLLLGCMPTLMTSTTLGRSDLFLAIFRSGLALMISQNYTTFWP